MTELEQQRARALATCRLTPASWEKRFARDMAQMAEHNPTLPLTPRQRFYLDELCYRYRRQLPPALVPAQRPSELMEAPAPKATSAKPAPTEPRPDAYAYHCHDCGWDTTVTTRSGFETTEDGKCRACGGTNFTKQPISLHRAPGAEREHTNAIPAETTAQP